MPDQPQEKQDEISPQEREEAQKNGNRVPEASTPFGKRPDVARRRAKQADWAETANDAQHLTGSTF